MSGLLEESLATRDAAAAKVTQLREQAQTLAHELRDAQGEYDATRNAVDHGLGLHRLGELKPKLLQELHAAHDAAGIKLRAATSASNLVLERFEAATAALNQAEERLRGVAATDASLLLAEQMERVSAQAAALCSTLTLAFELDALARGAKEIASGAAAQKIGGPASDILAHAGIGVSHTIHMEQFLGLKRERALMTPSQLLDLISG